MHPLLLRQLRKLGIEDPEHLPSNAVWKEFLQRVQLAYTENDDERYLNEQSLGILSQEMKELYDGIKSSQQRVAQESEKLRNVIQSISDGVCVLDDQGKIDLTNQACQRLLGMRDDELKNRRFFDLVEVMNEIGVVIPIKLDFLAADQSKSSNTEWALDFENNLFCINNKTFPTSFSINPLWQGNKLKGFVLIF